MNKLKTHKKNEKTVTEVTNATGCEKVCKTVNSVNLLTICQENYKRSFGKNIPQKFQTGKTHNIKCILFSIFVINMFFVFLSKV